MIRALVHCALESTELVIPLKWPATVRQHFSKKVIAKEWYGKYFKRVFSKHLGSNFEKTITKK